MSVLQEAEKGTSGGITKAKSMPRHRMMCLPQPNAVYQRIAICRRGRAQVAIPNSQGTSCTIEEQSEFLSWLRSRKEDAACSAVTVGISSHGRALIASRTIHAGECMLQVSRDLIITPDELPDEVKQLLTSEVSEWARLALFLLAEQHKGQASAWAPYVNCLPSLGGIHSTIFWRKAELAYLRHSPLHRETIKRRAVIRVEFGSVQNVLERCPHIFGGHVSVKEFKHAYATVCSRAWGIEALSSLALVPFVDFLNHDAKCRTLLSYDEDKQCAEVTADRDYATGEQVVISYGQLSNAILALDFGFTLPYNPHDQGEVWMSISHRDPLRQSKLQLLQSHEMKTFTNSDGSDSGGISFVLQEVKSPSGTGKGIPQSLKAFARVVCANTSEELEEMATDAANSDGRLARLPRKEVAKEMQAMMLVLAHVDGCIQQHVVGVAALQRCGSCLDGMRREMCAGVLDGELRVLRSASSWLKSFLSFSSVQ